MRNNTYRELSQSDENNPFAVFVVVELSNNKFAATTRPDDKNQVNKIGLPGGKVDPNENPKDAVIRESFEEGWIISGLGEIIASKMIDNKPVVYYYAKNAKPLTEYKEKYRGIVPIVVTKEEISNSGYGNEFIGRMFETSSQKKLDKIIDEEISNLYMNN